MHLSPSAPFELHGEFAGFVRNHAGKRRLRLRVAGVEIELKVPKDLRRQFAGRLVEGQMLAVRSAEAEAGKRVVIAMRILGATQAAATACPIRVCAKKNCWKSGGRELWQALERELVAAGISSAIRLQAVGCLDHCKHAPNAEWAGRDYRDCSPDQARALVAEAAACLRAPPADVKNSAHRHDDPC